MACAKTLHWASFLGRSFASILAARRPAANGCPEQPGRLSRVQHEAQQSLSLRGVPQSYPVVGKFFVRDGHETAEAIRRMQQEYENLQFLRGYGMAGYPHYIVRPLGTNAWLNGILVEEYAAGIP